MTVWGAAAGVYCGNSAVCVPLWLTPSPPSIQRGRGALTDVGELHSLTDWQVSEASEDAELEDFCHAEASRQVDEAGRPGGGENRPGHSASMQ